MTETEAQRQKEIQQAEELLFAGPQAVGFAKGLFLGHFVSDWVMPYPRIPAAQQIEADKSLAEVMADFQTAHQEVLEAIQNALESDLTDPNRFAWRNGEPFWPSVAGNTCGHYQEHMDLIQAWLDDNKNK